MKCFKCKDGRIRSIGYVIMQACFVFEKGKELGTHSFIEYALVGFEKASSPFCNGYILFTSKDFNECAGKLAQCCHELENFPDDDTEEPEELPFG
jgi:hypothetical protein